MDRKKVDKTLVLWYIYNQGGNKAMKVIDRTKIFTKYQNKWVALTVNEKVVGVGSTLEEAFKKASQKGRKDFFMTKIPDLRYGYVL